MDEHQRPLALPDVAVQLLPVAPRVAHQVQQVVLDLERGAEKEPERHEAIEPLLAARTDQRTDAARIDRGVPARLLEHHLEVVRIAQPDRVVAPPAELHRLSLDRLAYHAL